MKTMIDNVPKVYCPVTGDLLSKSLYDAKFVISKADEYYQSYWESIYRDDILMFMKLDMSDSEKLDEIKKYILE